MRVSSRHSTLENELLISSAVTLFDCDCAPLHLCLDCQTCFGNGYSAVKVWKKALGKTFLRVRAR